MIRSWLKRCTLIVMVILVFAFCAALITEAQSRGTEAIPEITFKPGQRTVIKVRTVTLPHGEGDMHNGVADRYTFNYRAGQRLTVSLKSDEGKAIFTINRAA